MYCKLNETFLYTIKKATIVIDPKAYSLETTGQDQA